jgi:hypothetical protein
MVLVLPLYEETRLHLSVYAEDRGLCPWSSI